MIEHRTDGRKCKGHTGRFLVTRIDAQPNRKDRSPKDSGLLYWEIKKVSRKPAAVVKATGGPRLAVGISVSAAQAKAAPLAKARAKANTYSEASVSRCCLIPR